MKLFRCENDNHVWKEGYYGYECENCEIFYPYGSAPWEPYCDRCLAWFEEECACDLENEGRWEQEGSWLLDDIRLLTDMGAEE